jgi:hypothetical protein
MFLLVYICKIIVIYLRNNAAVKDQPPILANKKIGGVYMWCMRKILPRY